jgi:hypothetical protein
MEAEMSGEILNGLMAMGMVLYTHKQRQNVWH